jgi:hypothetical protein
MLTRERLQLVSGLAQPFDATRANRQAAAFLDQRPRRCES